MVESRSRIWSTRRPALTASSSTPPPQGRSAPTCGSLLVRRQHVPNSRIFLPQHPRTKTLNPAIVRQIPALLECALIRVEHPFPHRVTIEVEPGVLVAVVPFDLRMIGVDQHPNLVSARARRHDRRLAVFP